MNRIIREAWNKSMPLHQRINKSYFDQAFRDRTFSVLSSIDTYYFSNVMQIKNKAVVQLCCNNGVELMSLHNMGASRTVGYDICDVAINEGRERCKQIGYPVELHRKDIYDLINERKHEFDVVYISVGSIRWLKDIKKLYSISHNLLKKNGRLFISDVHPIAEIINDDREPSKKPLEIIYSYKHECKQDYGSLDYVGHTNDILVNRVWYIHSFSEIIGFLPTQHFKLELFEESEHDLAGVYGTLKQQKVKVPLSFRMIAKAE